MPCCLDFVIADGERRVNPEYQLRNYIGKIVHSHSASELLITDRKVCLTFVIGEEGKPLGK